jgi:hypothetical protein
MVGHAALMRARLDYTRGKKLFFPQMLEGPAHYLLRFRTKTATAALSRETAVTRRIASMA